MRQWDPSHQPYKNSLQVKGRLFNFKPPTILFFGFVILITLGTLALLLPIASNMPTSIDQALFTATSAVTVTGLVVVDTGSHFTMFGQVVIALLIQAGGLGFMTFAILAAISLGAKLGFNQQLVAKEAFGQSSLDKVIQTAKYVLIYACVIELVGWLLLTLVWLQDKGLLLAMYDAFFYTISAFNNAGFALSSDSLSGYSNDISVNFIITALFIIGGIGFTVLIDLKRNHRWRKLSVNTRLVLLTTLIINLFAFLLIWVLEANNPNTLQGLGTVDQMLAAWFQAVTPRTAGFNTLPIDQLTDSTTTLMLVLMFIGGGSLSTASGIKLGTFIVLIMATYCFLRQRKTIDVMNRTIAQAQVMKALALTIISVFSIFGSIFILTITEDAEFVDIVFEVVSALSTVGLSRGLTGELSAVGEVIIIFLMLIGRLGPLTFAYLLATPNPKKIKFAEAEVQVG